MPFKKVLLSSIYQ